MEYENQIREVLEVALEKLHNISDAGGVIGRAYKTEDGKVIMPISKVTLAYIAGGGEYSSTQKQESTLEKLKYPFAGGSGGYVQLSPVGFLCADKENISAVPFSQNKSGMDKMLEEVSLYLQKQGKEVFSKTQKNKDEK